MVFRVVFLCVSALLVQSIAARSCGCSDYTPPPCGCNGGSISIGNVGCSRGSSVVSVSSPSVASCGSSIVSVSSPSVASCGRSIVSNNAPIVVSGPALASSGGAFVTTSLGAIVPSGIRVDNTNELCGELLVSGALPYLTAVAFEGTFPNSGVASVAYGCGTGDIAITDVIGGAAQSASYGGAILPAANYNSAILSTPSCGSAILPAPSCGSIQAQPSCGCNRIY